MITQARPSNAPSFNGQVVSVDFGTGAFQAFTDVSDASVTADQMVQATILVSDESYALDGVTVYIMNYIPGVGYTVYCNSPLGSVGIVSVMCQVIRKY